MLNVRLLVIFIGLLGINVIFGEELSSPLSEPAPIELDNSRFYIELLKMLGLLAIVVGVMILISWALKRVVSTRITQMNDSSIIKVIDQRTISPKTSVFVVEVLEKQVLIIESQNGSSSALDLSWRMRRCSNSLFGVEAPFFLYLVFSS